MIGRRRPDPRPAPAPSVSIHGKAVRIVPQRAIGKGGEADIYDLGGGRALKLFKTPDHPDFAGDDAARRAVAERLEEHQRKLPLMLAMPKPAGTIWPDALAIDDTGRVVGYAMPLVRPAEVLLRYSDQGFRRTGIGHGQIVGLLTELHGIVSRAHASGIVIGDFNDLNVLVSGDRPFLIDIDSAQFGPFFCSLFTARFLDPRLMGPSAPLLVRPHDADSDWYAFAVMVMQLLLFVDPYGGVHAPRDPAKRVPADSRPLQRITVFHSEVRYPKHALPLHALPDDLLHRLEDVFVRDRRGVFPLSLLDSLQWARCTCGLDHARAVCPRCTAVSSRTLAAAVAQSGSATRELIASTRGQFLALVMAGHDLLWLAHENGRFIREDGTAVGSGSLDPSLSFHLQRRATYLGRDGETIVLDGTQPRRISVDSSAVKPSFAVNAGHCFWISDGRLVRDGVPGPETIGQVLEGQTRFWVGPSFGLGFYRAGQISVAFVFSASRGALRDTVHLPAIGGQLIDADAVFTEDRCWLLLAFDERGRRRHRCVVINSDGAVQAMFEDDPRPDEWLCRIRGNTAVGPYLFAATDAGIVRVEVRGGTLAARRYPETEPFVDSETRLLATPHGLYAASDREVWRLTIG